MTISFFDFGESNTRALFNFLQDALAKNCEFEIRFGKFYQDKLKKYCFDSNVEIESFYNLKNMFENQKMKKTLKKTREFIYQDDNSVIKRIVDLDDNSVLIMSKQRVRSYDIYDYDLRMSVAYEKSDVSIKQVDDFSIIRTKDRTSYELPFGHLDFTIVEQNDCKRSRIHLKYEIEMEITSLDYKDMIMNYLMVILQKRQDNYYIIPGNEKKRVLYEYKNLVNANYFVGAQPETLHKEKIVNLYKSEYAVTDKADGDRYFMYIDKTGFVYFLDNNLNKILKTDLYSKYHETIIDGELIKYSNKICFLSFDILLFNGLDLRGKVEYNLKNRLQLLQTVVLESTKSEYYDLSVKEYYFGNVFSGSKKILDSVSEKIYKNDGLVFTPVNEPYPDTKKWVTLLKWKPCELNTIDFYCKRISSENGMGRWNLYIQAPVKNVETKRTEKVLFDIEKLCDDTSGVTTYETIFSDDLIDETTGETYKSDTVIEFRWDKQLLKFVPLRTRWDKTVNPSKHGNFVKVACDIWNNINNPIEKEYLLKFYSNTNEKDQYFERMRRFHNKVKEFLYNKYCKNVDTLLELCSGRGGDMHKWFYNNVKNVDGYDISFKNIEECKRRYDSSKKITNCNFYKLDLSRDDSVDIIYNNLSRDDSVDIIYNNLSSDKKYDTVCCHFGIHYFFDSEKSLENIINILDTCLKDGGYFVVSFMDNGNLDSLFGDKTTISYEENNEIVYMLERKMNGNSIYGNSLKITLNGNNILGEGSDEWIIDFDNFRNTMLNKGYTCIDTQLFSELYNPDLLDLNLLDCEKHISFLNRYCVFQKQKTVSKVEIPVITQQLYNGTTEFNFETIDLHQKNISVNRITSLYNIVDIINCIEYKYYKNEITNKTLDDTPENVFQDIVQMFYDLKIEQKPVFISDPLNFDQYQNDNCIYFTYYKHTIEKKTDENDEMVEYNNWYVVFYNDQLLFTKPQNYQVQDQQIQDQQVQDQQIQDQQIQDQQVQDDAGILIENVKKEYFDLKSQNKKITIKIFKELLLKLGLKVSGKREELEDRLEKFFN